MKSMETKSLYRGVDATLLQDLIITGTIGLVGPTLFKYEKLDSTIPELELFKFSLACTSALAICYPLEVIKTRKRLNSKEGYGGLITAV